MTAGSRCRLVACLCHCIDAGSSSNQTADNGASRTKHGTHRCKLSGCPGNARNKSRCSIFAAECTRQRLHRTGYTLDALRGVLKAARERLDCDARTVRRLTYVGDALADAAELARCLGRSVKRDLDLDRLLSHGALVVRSSWPACAGARARAPRRGCAARRPSWPLWRACIRPAPP